MDLERAQNTTPAVTWVRRKRKSHPAHLGFNGVGELDPSQQKMRAQGGSGRSQGGDRQAGAQVHPRGLRFSEHTFGGGQGHGRIRTDPQEKFTFVLSFAGFIIRNDATLVITSTQ